MTRDMQRVFFDAADLVDKGWCVGDTAQDAEGEPIDLFDDNAIAFCADGAIVRAAQEHLWKQPDAGKDSWAQLANLHDNCVAEMVRWRRKHNIECNTFSDILAWNDNAEDSAEISAALREIAGDLQEQVAT